ncbi:hypothetical protein HGA88_05650 [Candidatus Roizmanbacteria bacterium]|nr:hypothetical protein [Candidatus Roizmanbacteria bacterium]
MSENGSELNKEPIVNTEREKAVQELVDYGELLFSSEQLFIRGKEEQNKVKETLLSQMDSEEREYQKKNGREEPELDINLDDAMVDMACGYSSSYEIPGTTMTYAEGREQFWAEPEGDSTSSELLGLMQLFYGKKDTQNELGMIVRGLESGDGALATFVQKQGEKMIELSETEETSPTEGNSELFLYPTGVSTIFERIDEHIKESRMKEQNSDTLARSLTNYVAELPYADKLRLLAILKHSFGGLKMMVEQNMPQNMPIKGSKANNSVERIYRYGGRNSLPEFKTYLRETLKITNPDTLCLLSAAIPHPSLTRDDCLLELKRTGIVNHEGNLQVKPDVTLTQVANMLV